MAGWAAALLLVAACATAAAALFGWLGLSGRRRRSSEASQQSDAGTGGGKGRRAGHRVDVTRRQPSQPQQPPSHSHPLLVRQLKGHSDHCTAVCFGCPAQPPSRLLAVSSRDRLVRVWQLDSVADVVGVKMRFDYATALCFGDGNSQLFCAMSDSHSVDVFAIDAADGKLTALYARSFATAGRDAVTAMRCTATRLLLLMARGTDSPVLVYGAGSGQLMRSVAVNQLRNHDLAASSDGRLFAVATKLSDVKLWRVASDRSGAATGSVEHVTTLTGHAKAVQSVCFPSPDTACTLSSDGRLRCFNVAVRHADREEPKLRWAIDTRMAAEPFALRCSEAQSASSSQSQSQSASHWVLAVASPHEVRLYGASHSGCRELSVLADVGGQWGLAAVELRSDGQRLITLSTADKTALLWRVPEA